MFIMIGLSGLCNQKNNVQFQGGMVGKELLKSFREMTYVAPIPVAFPDGQLSLALSRDTGDSVVVGLQSPDKYVCAWVECPCLPCPSNQEGKVVLSDGNIWNENIQMPGYVHVLVMRLGQREWRLDRVGWGLW